jgi:cholesterol oxidase
VEYDFVIIGSGFGGSVSAFRLAEKGYRVAVVEQGRWVTPHDMEAAANSQKNLFWMPEIGLNGFFRQTVYKHLGIVGGVGVGGGSLVYAAVLLQPKEGFYQDPSWCNLGIDWQKEMAPFYEKASRMLGITENPCQDKMDAFLEQTAQKMGAGSTFGPTPMGIYFGTPEILAEDPFFDGQGPSRTGCHLCGECLTGCPHGAKNSLDKNYLYLAQKLGATVLPERKAVNIIPVENGGYRIMLRHPTKTLKTYRPITAKKVILSAGVLGTLELLFRCRDVTKTLPDISKEMGTVVRTNSEAIVGALSPDPALDLSRGTTISSDFYPDKHTHVTQNRFPKGYTFMKWYFGPLVNHDKPLIRAMITFGKIILNPALMAKNWFASNWYKRVTILTVMQNLDNQVSLTYGRSLAFLFAKRRLKSRKMIGKEAPTNLPIANKVAGVLAEITGGTPLNVIMESMGNLSFTAHILGGCHMGTSPANGVMDTNHQIFNYPGMYVIDGASISANVGVNPSLTITAMAERAMDSIPSKKDIPKDFFKHDVEVQPASPLKRGLKKLGLLVLVLLIINVALTGINILQKGGAYDGRSLDVILGSPANSADVDDIKQLSKSEIMQLFYAAPAPEFSSLKGEYQAETLPKGIMAPAADFYTHHFFGPGHWEGKAFYPSQKNAGQGYNLFSVKDENGTPVIKRERQMNTFVGKSEIDEKNSFHLVYKGFNGGMVKSMHDEIRQVNPNLYICMGYMVAGGGSINPAPFVLLGRPTEWVGPDKKTR